MTYAGSPLALEKVTFWAEGRIYVDKPSTIFDVSYLGIIERKSDGATVLSVRKSGAARAFNIETGRVISIAAHGREWRPETHSSRWMLRAAEIRAFVEGTELEDWAKPYFDPHHEKYHRNRSRDEADAFQTSPAPSERRVGSERGAVRLYDPRPLDDTQEDQPGFLKRLWRNLTGRS